ncbi:cytochrome oxidase assembly protein ShyY1 [Frondihabitans sp. PhB188]|uniref:SURF1 family cytochrome oxidase biogenesis protein n=1 Tax=Frondihabitans sp. PhB188 TaxID=2485200 RepID=UPI000F4758F7|nr:SURF1 family protein [Frondihabitans sp. PhB188]ROQ40974.1 cytochrome oxidase assembly protein ShyY1 [Frondihabitans sp. PhB188]
MKEWRFAFSRKWVGYFAVAVVFAIVCAFLSHWQWERRGENLALQHTLQANYDAEPVPLADVLTNLDSYSSADEFKPVTVTGTYLADDFFLARDRSYNGYPGFEVLVPLETSTGEVFVIDRGWVPTGNTHDYPDSIPAPPSGTVTVVARLAATEADVPGRTDIPKTNELAVIKPSTIGERLGLPTYTAAFGQLKTETPAASTLPKLAQKPSVDYGLNLSYAIQWVMFALAAFGFFIYVIRQEYDARNSDEEDQRWLDEERERKRLKRGPDDAEIEDAHLDEVGWEESTPGAGISR